MVHVPFRGSSQSVPALVGGQVDFLFAALPSMLGFVKSGQVIVLASNAPKRSASASDTPSIAETIPGFDFSVSVGVLARTGTPPERNRYFLMLFFITKSLLFLFGCLGCYWWWLRLIFDAFIWSRDEIY